GTRRWRDRSWTGPGKGQSWEILLRNSNARAARLISRTNAVSTKAPDQASCCQDSYGLPAYWYITTGTLAIGCSTLEFQYWLPKAVNSSGAVSPEMRASDSRMPVTMPAEALR